jgi:hypothetical protein
MAAAIDDSCRRPGSIPFKWEICPGTPKHARSSSASAAPSSSSSPYYSSSSATASVSKVAVSPKLTPPPAMSPSPYHSPRVSYYPARSASVSPSRRRAPHRPTAFLDVNPRVAPTYRAGAAEAEDDEVAVAPAGRCFPLPVFRRRDGRKGSRRTSSGTGTASATATSFRSDGTAPGGLRRSASTSSSSCLSLSSRSSGKLAEAREVEATGGWFY